MLHIYVFYLYMNILICSTTRHNRGFFLRHLRSQYRLRRVHVQYYVATVALILPMFMYHCPALFRHCAGF